MFEKYECKNCGKRIGPSSVLYKENRYCTKCYVKLFYSEDKGKALSQIYEAQKKTTENPIIVDPSEEKFRNYFFPKCNFQTWIDSMKPKFRESWKEYEDEFEKDEIIIILAFTYPPQNFASVFLTNKNIKFFKKSGVEMLNYSDIDKYSIRTEIKKEFLLGKITFIIFNAKGQQYQLTSNEVVPLESTLRKLVGSDDFSDFPKIKCPFCEKWFYKVTEDQYRNTLAGNVARGIIFVPWGVVKALKNKPYIECPHCKMKIMQG